MTKEQQTNLVNSHFLPYFDVTNERSNFGIVFEENGLSPFFCIRYILKDSVVM